MIEVHQLTKTFRVHKKKPGLVASMKSLFHREYIDKHAVNEVSFSIAEGEIVGLIGANGAGKTTLVKMLAGIIHPTRGEARVLGYVPWERDNRFRQQVALIMGQKASLWWDLPAADCLMLLREIYRLPKEQFDRNVEELVTLLDAKEQMNIQIRRLSLGERMKMELIAALLHSPRAVYLDEPTIGLDLTAQRAIREFILNYRKRHNPAMIITSHYMEDIERLCERIIIMREGQIVYDGSLSAVVRSYAKHKIITARFADGSTNGATRDELAAIGDIQEFTPELVRIHVPREQVAPAAARVIEITHAKDLSIEEEEIGTIIESIMRERGMVRT